MYEHAPDWLVEFLEFGYFTFYPLYPVVGGLFWLCRDRPPFLPAFRKAERYTQVGYAFCYAM